MQHKRNLGITLLEILLVISIMAVILALSIRQYQVFKRDTDIQALQYNIDSVFNAMVGYFRANCRQRFIQQSRTVNLTVQELINFHYLVVPNNLIPPNSLVDPHTGDHGYSVQFNQVLKSNALPQRMVGLDASTNTTTAIGNVSVWNIQVAVKLKDPSTAQQYKNILLANCVSHSSSGTSVAPCPGRIGDNEFLVFERLPAFASSQYNSQIWVMNPLVRSFTQMYTTLPMLILTGDIQGQYVPAQYFYCGGSDYPYQ